MEFVSVHITLKDEWGWTSINRLIGHPGFLFFILLFFVDERESSSHPSPSSQDIRDLKSLKKCVLHWGTWLPVGDAKGMAEQRKGGCISGLDH